MNLWGQKIMVTGGAGFVGKFIVEKLIKRGCDKNNIKVPLRSDCDLRIWENCVQAVKGVNLVIHLAARVGGIGYNRNNPGTLFYDNMIMGTQLMEAARREKVDKFVAVGTICAYPKFTPVPFKEEDLWNGYPEETNAPYGLAKKMMLVQSQAYRQQYGFNSIYLLPVNLYGPGDNFNPESSHVIPALIKKVAEAQKNGWDFIEVWGTGKATREFLYVENAAEGIILATENYEKEHPVNLGAGKEISINDLVHLICEILNFAGEIRWNPIQPDGQPRRCLDVLRAKAEFGFEAKTSLKEGLAKTIDWYLNCSPEHNFQPNF